MIIGDKMIVEFSEYSKEKRWFSVKTITGGTSKQPYSPITLDELKGLRNEIDTAIKILEGGK
jgi:hypothetical protein